MNAVVYLTRELDRRIMLLLILVALGCHSKETVSGVAWVYVLRGHDGHRLPGAAIRLELDKAWRDGKSDEFGRAYFYELKSGAKYTVTATLDGQSGSETFVANETNQDVVIAMWDRPQTELERLTKRVAQLEARVKSECESAECQR